jgi:outer membrane receptor protein involved in Fe transport
MKRYWFMLAAAATVAGCAPRIAAQAPEIVAAPETEQAAPASAAPAPVAVDSARMLRDLGILAHDSMEGRATGTPGSVRAREFV